MPDVHPISMRPVFALTRSPLVSTVGDVLLSPNPTSVESDGRRKAVPKSPTVACSGRSHNSVIRRGGMAPPVAVFLSLKHQTTGKVHFIAQI